MAADLLCPIPAAHRDTRPVIDVLFTDRKIRRTEKRAEVNKKEKPVLSDSFQLDAAQPIDHQREIDGS